jgi:hypothetical protein
MYWEYIAEIIKAASTSVLGIFALMIIAISILAYYLFRKENPLIKFGVFLFLFSGVVMFGYKVYQVEPEKIITRPSSISREPSKAQPKAMAVKPKIESQEATIKSKTMGSIPSESVLEPSSKLVKTRVDCGEYWTNWIEVGGAVGNPCPEGCERGNETSQAYRLVGFPPRPQTKHKFQCWKWELK